MHTSQSSVIASPSLRLDLPIRPGQSNKGSSVAVIANLQAPTHQSPISAIEPDWSREQLRQWWDPSRQLLKFIRQYQRWQGRGGVWGLCLSKLSVIQHRFWSMVSGADIPLNCQIGGGLLLPHPNGVVIHPDAESVFSFKWPPVIPTAHFGALSIVSLPQLLVGMFARRAA